MRPVLVVILLASVALAQQPRPARDAGVAAPDAGSPTTAPQPPKPDLSDRAQSMEIDKLKKEVAELRTRLADLEQRAQKSDSRADALAKQLDALGDKVDELKQAEDKRQEAEKAAANRKLAVQQANAALTGALQQLSLGNTNVEAALRVAESSYQGNALQLVQLARRALGSDVLLARQLLALAIIEADATMK